MAKIQPAQRTLIYGGTPSSGNLVMDIDIARDLSAINRRLYRQGMQYYVQSVEISRADTGITTCAVLTAGDTWMVHNAWKKGFRLWKSQQDEVEDVMPGLQGKWADFKIELDDNSSTLINPVAGDAGTILSDEWNLSNFVWDDDGTERQPTFCLIGASVVATKIGLVQEYHISRAQVDNQPQGIGEASDSIYAKSLGTDEMSDLLVDVVELDNDSAPYDMDEMVGGDTVADAPFTQDIFLANLFQKGISVGFTAECGLVRLQLTSTTADGSTASDVAHLVKFTLAPGSYKGVMAAPMGQ